MFFLCYFDKNVYFCTIKPSNCYNYEEIYKNKTEEKKDITPPDENQTEIKNIKNDINNINTEIKNNINQRIKELTEIISKKDIENLNIIQK